MLKSLRIHNFRSIIDAKLEFGRVNLLIGSNGSGKSNILEAIGTLSAALGVSIAPRDLDYRGVRLSLPHLFKASFKNRAIPKTFRLISEIGEITYSVSLRAGEHRPTLEFFSEEIRENGQKILGRSPHGSKIHKVKKGHDPEITYSMEPTRGVWDTLGQFSNISTTSAQTIENLSQFVIYTPQTAIMRGMGTDTRVIEPLGLTGGRLPTALEEVLHDRYKNKDRKKFIEDVLSIVWAPGWANHIRTGEFNPEIVPDFITSSKNMIYVRDKFMATARNFLSPYDASEGTIYLIFVATLLAHPQAPKIFALDNIDGTLNPGLVRKLVSHVVNIITCQEDQVEAQKRTRNTKEFSRFADDGQVFMTSHNPTALDAIDLFNPDHRVFIVSRDEESGATLIDPLLPPEGIDKKEWMERAGGRNLSQMWLEGLIERALG